MDISTLTVFILAIFVGFEIITKEFLEAGGYHLWAGAPPAALVREIQTIITSLEKTIYK